MIKRALLLFSLLLTACGGANSPPAPSTTFAPAGLSTVASTPAATVEAALATTVLLPTHLPAELTAAEAPPTALPATGAPTAAAVTAAPTPTRVPPPPSVIARSVLPTPPPAGIADFSYQIVNRYPHDAEAFTQGLVYVDGTLYEGTGLNGRSSLRRVDLLSGAVVEEVALNEAYFGEGIAVWADRIIQLTWQSNIALVYDRNSLAPLGRFSYPTEGWGLTHDGTRLLMSDGSSRITFRDPETFVQLGSIDVVDDQGPVVRLNELEYIEGSLFANVWQTDTIVRIDPQIGRVTGRVDLSGLLAPQERAAADVLNGIAYDIATGRLFVTGKWWPWLFEIVLVPASD